MSQAQEDARSPLPLRALRLRPGMFLQLQTGAGQAMIEAKFCAAIENKGVMLVPLDNGNPQADWNEGMRLDVRGFSGQYDFSFPSRVLGNFSVPFAYLLVSYPEQVQAQRVRSALRIPTSLSGEAWGRDAAQRLPAHILDLSAAGAMIDLQGQGLAVGDEMHLKFEIEFERRKHALQLAGRICHAASSGETGSRVGIAFSALNKPDRLLLQAFTLAAAQSNGIID